MGNVIVPQIFSNAVNELLPVTLRIGRVAYDATSDVSEIRQSGDRITWPRLNRNAQAVLVQKGTPLVPSEIDMTDMTGIISHMAVPLRVFDSELIQIKGRTMDNLVEQCATEMARYIDHDLTVAMDTDAIYKSPTVAATAITADEIFEGMTNFGDRLDSDSFAGIVASSKLWPSFVKMPEFVSSELTHTTAGNGKTVNGVIGYLMGCPVIICDNGTWDETLTEAKTYIVKKNSLGYIFQRDIQIEEERDLLLLATNIVASSLFCTKLLEPKGVVVLRKTA